jgi:hypothetical protein
VKLKSYRLQSTDTISLHSGRSRPQLLHDNDDSIDPAQVQKLVASGDGFISLATLLADTTQMMAVKPEKAGPELEKIILTLLYLQDHYEIYRKLTPHP